jgi:MtN3 and saliva related transmembrane protein
MDFAVIGYLAGTLTTLSFVPQVVRAWRTRHADDIAWGWLIIFQLGLGLWLTYGVVLRNWPMILANTVTMTLCTVLMVMKHRFAKPTPKLAQMKAAD